jgi:hypothetical protein
MQVKSVIHSGIATGGSKTTVVDALVDFPTDAVKDKYIKVLLGGKALFRKITTNTGGTFTFLTLGDAAGASAVVKAATAVTDKLTIALANTTGYAGNEPLVNLTTAEDDTLAVSKDDDTKTITIALADTTASKNAAALIQAAIRALGSVANVSVAAATCTAGGNWDTAAVATGETAPVQFSGGAPEIATPAGANYEIFAI